MTRVQCLCGADLAISEASSGVVMRVETHSCAGFNPLNPHAPAHESPGTVYELWSEAGNLVDTFATLQEARAASDPSDVGITAVADGQVVGSFELHATGSRAAMTTEAAQAVAEIALTADGGCHVCAGSLINQLKERFPAHAAIFQNAYDKEWGDD